MRRLLLLVALCAAAPLPGQTVRTVTLTPDSASVTVGDTVRYTASAFAASRKRTTSYAFTFTVADPRVATVTRTASTGTAVAVARDTGRTVVFATANGVTRGAVLRVRVKPAPLPPPVIPPVVTPPPVVIVQTPPPVDSTPSVPPASALPSSLVALAQAGGAGCLAAPAATEGARVALAPCAARSAAQAWLVEPTGRISTQGLCLNAFGGTGLPGDPVGLYRCAADANERWVLGADGALRGINGLCVVAADAARYQLGACGAAVRFTAAPTTLPAAASTLTAAAPTLPTEVALPTDAVVTGRTWRVPAGSDRTVLDSVVAHAQPGDEIVLAAGGTYANLWLPPRRGAGWITVRTDLPATGPGALPPAGTRLDSATARRLNLARIIGGRANDPVIYADNGTGGWRFVGVEVTQAPQYLALNTLIALGWGNTASAAAAPADFVFDRTYVHAVEPAGDLTRCFLINSARTAIVNSTLTCHGASADAMAIGGWGGPGPFRIENNSIAGSGHGLIFGGNDPLSAEIMPADVVIRGNRIWTPLAWIGVWPKKTLLEFKIGHRILIEANVFEQTWDDAQNGFAILLKSTNQSGTAPFSQTSDVTVRHNWIRNVAGAFNLAARPETLGGLKPADPLSRVLITDNVVENVCAPGGTKPNGNLMQLTGDLRDVQIVRNTFLHDGSGIGCGGRAAFEAGADGAERLIIERNILTAGAMGWNSSDGHGTRAFSTAASWQARDNVMVGLDPFEVWRYPVGTTLVPTLGALGLTGYALPLGSPYAGVGADAAAVRQATAGARAMGAP